MQEFTGIIGVLVGGLLTWFVSSRQRKFDLEKEKRALLIAKYEELHKTLGELSDSVAEYTAPILTDLAFDSGFDFSKVKNRIPSDKVDMLIEFYVPELKGDHEYIKKQVNFLYEHISKHALQVSRTETFKLKSAVMAQELNKATKQTVTQMKKKLAELAGELIGA